MAKFLGVRNMASDDEASDYAVKAVKEVLDRKVFPPATTIFQEGDGARNAYILLRGDVTIVTGMGGTLERVLVKIKPGQMFGELALMAKSQRTASARTETGCELLTISQEKLQKKLGDADPFVRYWIEYLSKRVIDLTATKHSISDDS